MSLTSILKKAKNEVGHALKTAAGGVGHAASTAARGTGNALKVAAGRGGRVVRSTLEAALKQDKNLALTLARIVKDVDQAFRKDFVKGLIELGKTPLEILEAAAKHGAATVGVVFADLVEIWGSRPLKPAEKAEAKKVFGKSIPLDEVRIATGVPVKLVHTINGHRPFTTIRLLCFDSEAQLRAKGTGTLIHELTHVWQFEKTGPVYMVDALEAQARKGDRAYEVTPEMLARNRGDLRKFNPEQQATIVERYWESRWGRQANAATARQYEPYARKVYAA